MKNVSTLVEGCDFSFDGRDRFPAFLLEDAGGLFGVVGHLVEVNGWFHGSLHAFDDLAYVVLVEVPTSLEDCDLSSDRCGRFSAFLLGGAGELFGAIGHLVEVDGWFQGSLDAVDHAADVMFFEVLVEATADVLFEALVETLVDLLVEGPMKDGRTSFLNSTKIMSLNRS